MAFTVKGLVFIDKYINVLIIEPKKLPKVEKIENTLESKQKIVDGYIEYVSVPKYDDILIICNEEGKLRHMEFNRDIGYDIIAGPMIIVGEDKSGNDTSLTEEQIKKYKEVFDERSINKTQAKVDKILNNMDLLR